MWQGNICPAFVYNVSITKLRRVIVVWNSIQSEHARIIADTIFEPNNHLMYTKP